MTQCLVSFIIVVALIVPRAEAFSAATALHATLSYPKTTKISTVTCFATIESDVTATSTGYSFIQTELRGAAMKLHTREQSPKEGKVDVQDRPRVPYVPTRSDYLSFLVDSLYVYQAMEDVVNANDGLAMFRNTGLERCAALEKDIVFMTETYGLQRPEVGKPGLDYAQLLRQITSIPEFVCHYYNHYFAHTAGGRMIGKQMSALLLDRKTLEFYMWDGNLNEIKESVKHKIEVMASAWSEEEKRECVEATALAFQAGGAINSYLSGGQSPNH